MSSFSGKHRACLFTINRTDEEVALNKGIRNPDPRANGELDEDYEFPLSWKFVKYICFQAEFGDCGREHIQGYVIWEKPFSLTMLKEVHPHAEWLPRKGTHVQAKVYCMKEEGRTAGPFEAGEEPKQGERNDMLGCKDLLDAGRSWTQLYEDHFGTTVRYRKGLQLYKTTLGRNKRTWQTYVVVYYGPTRMGKSRKAFHDCEEECYVFKKPLGGSVFMDGYDGEEVVIFDEFDGSWFPFTLLLKLFDRFELPLDTKGGKTSFAARKIIITTNVPPTRWYPNVSHDLIPSLMVRLKPPLGVFEVFDEEWKPPIDCGCKICTRPERTDMIPDFSRAVDPETLCPLIPVEVAAPAAPVAHVPGQAVTLFNYRPSIDGSLRLDTSASATWRRHTKKKKTENREDEVLKPPVWIGADGENNNIRTSRQMTEWVVGTEDQGSSLGTLSLSDADAETCHNNKAEDYLDDDQDYSDDLSE